jgi:hypothetical protein
MGKKINVMLYDRDMGIFETEFEQKDGETIFCREYNSGNILIINHKGETLAEFKAEEWLAYAVEKVVEDEDGEEE